MIWLFYIISVALAVILNFNKSNFYEVFDELIFFFLKFLKIFIIISLAFFLKVDLNMIYNNGAFLSMMHSVFYFFLLIYFFIIINYFGTRYVPFRNCIKSFVQSTINFINNNMMLNILFYLFLFFTLGHPNISIGLITAYAFYALTEICSEYKNNKNVNVKYSVPYIVMFIILNIILVLCFANVEQALSAIFNNKYYDLTLHRSTPWICLIVILILNKYMPYFLNWFYSYKIIHK